MLLQRIELKGFLCYVGRTCDSGSVAPMEIDFRKAPLWLVHGHNGAGKSALFDAITFALFKCHRGGKSNFDCLIHDAADTAEVNLEIELNGGRYLVQRTIRRSRYSSKVWGIVRYWTGDDWKALPGTTNKVEDWVRKNLRMSYDTFVSAVLLRQGEADAFLKAKPTERKTRLLELLDLGFYQELGKAANSQRTDWRKAANNRQQELDGLQAVTEEDLGKQQEAKDQAECALGQATQCLATKEAELIDARKAADYNKQITDKETQQQRDAELIAQDGSIVSAARRYRELQPILPQLGWLWDARHRLADEEGRIQKTGEQIAELQVELEPLSVQIAEACQLENAAADELSRAKKALDLTVERQRNLADQLGQLDRIERLERQIDEAKRDLKPYMSILEQSAHIEQCHQRYESLREGVPLLEALGNATQQFVKAQECLQAAQKAVADAKESVGRAVAEEELRRKDVAIVADRQTGLLKKLHPCQGDLSILRDKLKRRDEIAQAEECPICGSLLTSDDARARLEHERSRWQKEIGGLEAQEGDLNGQLKECEQAREDAEGALKSAVDATQKARTTFDRAGSDRGHADNSLTNAQTAANVARKKAGAWANQLDQLPDLTAELSSLNTIPDQWKELEQAKRVEAAFNTTTAVCQKQMVGLPAWSPDERQQLRMDADTVAEDVSACQTEKAIAEEKTNAVREKREAVEKEQRRIKGERDLAQHLLDDVQKRKDQAELDVARRQAALPAAWSNHPACADESAVNALKDELTGLSQAEEQEKRLHEAQSRVTEIAGAIQMLRGLLKAIPVAHRRDVVTVEAERDQTGETVKECTTTFEDVKQQLLKMGWAKQRYDGCLQSKNNAEREFGYYSRLALAFGRDGLQAQIVKQAQQSIVTYANMTLGQLSNGRWQIDLRENDQKTEMEILARDLSQPGMPCRSFEYLSGGEKFRVAISVAVAIGQSISGGRTVDTLIIDEGFGSLDEVNRELLVGELRRLSDDVLQGGRVIIVSHETDVFEEFGSRYHISRDADGMVQMECSLLP